MTAGLFHYDLDGVVSNIVMSQGIKFEQTLKGGYQRFDQLIGWIKPGQNVVVADVCLTLQQFIDLKRKSKTIIYLDHHPDSVYIEEQFTNDIVIFDKERSGAALCRDFIAKKKELSKAIKLLAKATHHYDLFHRRDEPDWFAFGYDLNILFWKYHYDDFFARFKDGFEGFTKAEKEIIKTYKTVRDQKIAESAYIKLEGEKNGLVCVPADNNLQNDIPYHVPGADVYYIIMKWPKSTSISVRAVDTLDLTDYYRGCEMHPLVVAAGGHPQAGGINFNGQPSDEVIVEVIQEMHDNICAEKKCDGKFSDEDIPF